MRDIARETLEAGCYAYEDGNVSKAARLFLKAARMGSTEAQVNLANILDRDGKSSASDFNRARYWYKRAIQKGSAEGAYNLAVSYRLRGNGRMDGFWLERAARMGDEDAIDELKARRSPRL